jgi:hypothetical protein
VKVDFDLKTDLELYAVELKARMQEAFSTVIENKQRSQKDNQLNYDKKAKVIKYEIDEKAYLKNNERVPKGMKKKMMTK